MTKRQKRKPKTIPMKIGNDPSLWRYASLHDALAANTQNLAQLIRKGKEIAALENAQSDHSVSKKA